MRKTITRLSQVPSHLAIPAKAESTEAIYRFRAPAKYLELIDPGDPDDPIRKLILPTAQELAPFDSLDPTSELSFTVAPGLQHKFPDTALLLSTVNCAGYCRYCFRKRLFQPNNTEVPSDFTSAVDYVRRHAEVTNVLLSGGDPLSLRTAQLLSLLEAVSAIDHVKIIRLGSKTPAFDPERILDDSALLQGLEKIADSGKQVYLIAHFDHPRELTVRAKASVKLLQKAGVSCLNQCPLLNGVNTASGVLNHLFEEVAAIGCPQYYVFHCRPTDGNTGFALPLLEAFSIFERETRDGSGLSKTARYCIAHPKGKLQVLASDGSRLLLKFIQAHEPKVTGVTFWHDADADLRNLPF